MGLKTGACYFQLVLDEGFENPTIAGEGLSGSSGVGNGDLSSRNKVLSEELPNGS